MRKLLTLVVAISFALPSTTFAVDYGFPKNDGFVTDQANIIDELTERQLETTLQNLSDEKGIEIAVVTVDSLKGRPINDYTLNLGREWGVGLEGANSGVVYLVAPNERETRIEVGFGLEGSLTDVESYWIIQDALDYFRADNYSEGISFATTQIIDSIENENFADRKQQNVDEPISTLFFIIFFPLMWGASILGRSKRAWPGGIIGGLSGFLGAAIVGYFQYIALIIPLGVLIGFFFDLLVSKNYNSKKKTSWWAGGSNRHWWDGPSSGGGFGGFSGGSFGGGGSSGSW
jgi:uncharacterized protein